MRTPLTAGILDVAITNPAAGADWSYTVPLGARLQLLYGTATLTTSVTVNNRRVHLLLSATAGTMLDIISTGTQAASTAVSYAFATSWVTSQSVAIAAQGLLIPSPLILQPGDIISTSTQLIAAADQWSLIRLRFAHLING